MCKALGVDTLSYTQIHKDQKETCCKINDMPSPEVTLLHLNASGPCRRHHGPYSLMHTTPVCMIPESRAPVAQHIHPTINHGPYFPAHVSWQTMASTSSYIQFTSNHNPYPLKYAPTTVTDPSFQPAHPTAALTLQHRHTSANHSSCP